MSSITAAHDSAANNDVSLCDETGSSCAAGSLPAQPPVPPPAQSPASDTKPVSKLDHASMFCLIATREGGVAYDGDLLSDVIEYRELRASHLRGAISDDDAARLPELEEKLRQPSQDDDDTAPLRAFYRWSCEANAVVVAVDEDGTRHEFGVKIEDMSAGGVKAVADHEFAPGDAVDLRFEHSGGFVEFPSRVAWVRDTAFGMMFAGAARRDRDDPQGRAA